MRAFAYERPTRLEDAVALLAEHGPDARPLAGGTDLIIRLRDRTLEPRVVIDVKRIEGLDDGIRPLDGDDSGLVIGARAVMTTIAADERIRRDHQALAEGAAVVGSVQIRNRATLAGNLCNASPAADGVPPLLVLDAAVELASASGTRRLPLAEFLLGNRRTARGPDEVMTAILIPAGSELGRSAFLKLGARRYLVISIAMVAVLLAAEGGRIAAARIAVGSCSAVARRLPDAEAALLGAEAGPELGALIAPSHLAPLSPIDDVRGTASYRREAALELIRRAVAACRPELA